MIAMWVEDPKCTTFKYNKELAHLLEGKWVTRSVGAAYDENQSQHMSTVADVLSNQRHIYFLNTTPLCGQTWSRWCWNNKNALK